MLPRVKPLDQLTLDDFSSRVGESFVVDLGGEVTLRLELVSAEALGGSSAPGARRAPFSLVFRSPGERRHVLQRTYPMEHAALGRLELFLVPIGTAPGGMRYEAVFT